MTKDDQTSLETPTNVNSRVRFQITLARLALWWEQVWRALWPVAVILGLFVALTLAGLWQSVGGYYHLVGLLTFAVMLIFACLKRFPLIKVASREEGRRRLETDSGVLHRPVQELEDRLANGDEETDPATHKLWLASRKRALEALSRLRTGWPRPELARRDPLAFRFAAGLLLFIGIMAAGSDATERLAGAFAPDLTEPVPVAVFEGWVTPPDYTGKAPVLLTAHGKNLARPADPTGEDDTETVVSVPVNSTLVLRLHGGTGSPVLKVGSTRIAATVVDAKNHELTHKLDRPMSVALRQDNRELGRWTFATIPDEPPQAAIEDKPTVTARLALKIPLLATDDYGLTRLRLSLAHKQQSPEIIDIPLPGHAPDKYRQKLFRDFTPHKWAGLEVTLRLEARDASGQTGLGQARILTLPERQFAHPVARAIIEQRRRLASGSSKDNTRSISRVLRIISGFPEEYDNDSVVTLSLRSAVRRLELNRHDKARDEVIDILWDTALRIEDGVLSLAERRLRQAEQNLMEALSGNASQAEIDRLTEELKQAMDQFLQAMLEEMAKNPQAQSPSDLPVDPNIRSVDRQDLQRMLERARELSKLGARDAAKELLSQLRNMLENLRSGVRQGQMSARSKAGQQALSEMGKLMRRQQELMDQSLRRQQSGKARPGDKQSRAAAAEQEALRKRLGEVMRQLGEARGNIPRQLGRAERAMRGAGKSLEKGQPGRAAPQQGTALQQMRAGAEALAKAMAGERMGQGQMGRRPMPMPGQHTDPLGRPLDGMGRNTDGNVKIPDESTIQRARKVLKELHNRASDLTRPMIERDYLDRLLQRF